MKELSTTGRRVCADSALPPCQLSFGQTAGLRQISMGNGAVRAEILLDKGANVRQFWDVAREARTLAEAQDWSERLAEFHRGGRRGSSYSDYYEGGWQDVLPARARWGDSAIGDGDGNGDGAGVGEAAIAAWEVTRSVCTVATANVVCTAQLPRCGLEVVKRFGVRRGDAALRVQTTVRNASRRDVWLNWTQHPALGGDLLDGTSRLWLPGGEPRVTRHEDGSYTDSGRIGREGSASFRWVDVDAVMPPAASPDRFVTYAGVERGAAALASRTRALGVRLRWDAAVFPHVWLWCARRDSICCVAVEPSTTYLPELLPQREPPILRLLRPGDSMRTWLELSTFTLRPGFGADA